MHAEKRRSLKVAQAVRIPSSKTMWRKDFSDRMQSKLDEAKANIWFTSFKNINGMQRPSFSLEDWYLVNPRTIHVTVKADKVAVFVWMDTDLAGHFSDNLFVLHPCQPQDVYFHSAQLEGRRSVEELRKSITITSLVDHIEI